MSPSSRNDPRFAPDRGSRGLLALTVPVVFASLSLFACAGTPPSVAYTEYPPWKAPVLTAAEAALDDGQIAEIADAIDVQQIETARVAVDRSSDADVSGFARELVVDDANARATVLHAARREKAGLQPSILVDQFESQARDTRAWLLSEPRASFDRDFLASEVEQQTRQLDLLDHVLVPGAHGEMLRARLAQRRQSVEQKLGEARRLSQRFPPL